MWWGVGSNTRAWCKWLTLAGQLLALAAIPCLAQQMPSLGLSAYAGQNVSSVDIAGQPDVTLHSVQGVIAVKQASRSVKKM